jgi:hypothetical protein
LESFAGDVTLERLIERMEPLGDSLQRRKFGSGAVRSGDNWTVIFHKRTRSYESSNLLPIVFFSKVANAILTVVLGEENRKPKNSWEREIISNAGRGEKRQKRVRMLPIHLAEVSLTTSITA